MENHFYEFRATSLQGTEISMDTYRDRVVLVVNTASQCGFTPQYEGLEALYRRFRNDGLVILGFPCNQFAHQEPGDEASIASQCLLHYGVTFPMFGKVRVNGRQAHPLYSFLKRELRGTFGNAIKWNFTKFLLDRTGTPVKRFAPTITPESMTDDIQKLLAQDATS